MRETECDLPHFMHIESAHFTADALMMIIDGHPAFSDTKKSLLDAGIAVLHDEGDAEPYFASATQAVLPADPGNGRAESIIRGGTTDPRIVALARRYWDAANSDDFREGPVEV